MKCEMSLLRCLKCSAYLPNVNYSYCCTCVNYSLFQRMSSETLWDSHRKKIFDTHQKRFYFYIFASVELLLLQFLFLQISCKIWLRDLSQTTTGYHRTFPNHLFQSFIITIESEQFCSFVTCSFLLSIQASRFVAVFSPFITDIAIWIWNISLVPFQFASVILSERALIWVGRAPVGLQSTALD